MKINKKYIFEFISILLGVSVALVINTAWSGYEHHKLADTASKHLYLEVADNLGSLDSMIIIHEKTLETIDNLLIHLKKKKEDPTYNEEFSEDFTLYFPLLKNTAWETAKISNAVTYMNFEAVSDFNNIFTLQDMYLRSIETFVEHSSTDLQLLKEKEKLTQMKSFMTNILSREHILSDNYKEILKKNK